MKATKAVRYTMQIFLDPAAYDDIETYAARAEWIQKVFSLHPRIYRSAEHIGIFIPLVSDDDRSAMKEMRELLYGAFALAREKLEIDLVGLCGIVRRHTCSPACRGGCDPSVGVILNRVDIEGVESIV